MRVQNGDIAKTDKPFGPRRKGSEIDGINDTTETVTATAEKDSAHLRIVKKPLQVGQPFPISTGKIVRGAPPQRLANDNPITPCPQRVDTDLCFFARHKT